MDKLPPTSQKNKKKKRLAQITEKGRNTTPPSKLHKRIPQKISTKEFHKKCTNKLSPCIPMNKQQEGGGSASRSFEKSQNCHRRLKKQKKRLAQITKKGRNTTPPSKLHKRIAQKNSTKEFHKRIPQKMHKQTFALYPYEQTTRRRRVSQPQL